MTAELIQCLRDEYGTTFTFAVYRPLTPWSVGADAKLTQATDFR